MGEIAFNYLMLGLSVVPVTVKGKRPALETWREYTSMRATPQQLKRWWEINPDQGVGIITGKLSRVVVIDCDDWDLSQQLLKQYPTTWVAISPGHNSYHLYYRYPQGVDHVPNAKLFNGKADFRGDGGFVVAPPTIHPNGKRYVWHSKEGAYPPDLPTAVLNIVMGRTKDENGGVDHWIADLLTKGSRSGSRDADATRLAGYMVKKGMARDVILIQMRPWFENTDADRDFSWKSVEKCVDSVIQTHKRANPHSPLEEVITPTSIDNIDDHITPFFEYIDGEDQEDIKWLIEGWLPQNSTALMVAPPGTYKTWIMIAMAIAVSCGVPFMGQEVKEAFPVLIIQQEDSKDILKQRLKTVYGPMVGMRAVLGVEDGVDFIEFANFHIEPKLDMKESDKLIHFDDPDSMLLLKNLIEKHKYKLVFIDPLYMSADADNYMAKAAQQMGVLKALRDAYGVTFVVLHHTKKTTAEEGVARMDSWGSQFINAWLETGIQLRTTDLENTVKVLLHFKNHKGNKANLVQFTIDTDPANRQFEMKVIDNPDEEGGDEQEDKVVRSPEGGGKFGSKVTDRDILDTLLMTSDAMTSTQMAKAIKDRFDISITERTARDKLKKLTREGKAVEHADHTFSVLD